MGIQNRVKADSLVFLGLGSEFILNYGKFCILGVSFMMRTSLQRRFPMTRNIKTNKKG